MSFLLETAIKISLVTGLGLVAVMLLRRGSAALRHWMLAAAFLIGIARKHHHQQVRNNSWATFFAGDRSTKSCPAAPLGE